MALSLLLVLATSAPAAADLVRLTNGRTIAADRTQMTDDAVVLWMGNGTRTHLSRSLVTDVTVESGEAARARQMALAALADSPWSSSPRLTSTVLRALVDRVARRIGVDTRLAHAIVQAESNYEPLAISARGAMGLMQITPVIADSYAVGDPYDPEQNLEAGLKHLLGLVKRFGTSGAIAAYNAGAAAVMRYGGVPPFGETQAYVRRVLAAMH